MAEDRGRLKGLIKEALQQVLEAEMLSARDYEGNRPQLQMMRANTASR